MLWRTRRKGETPKSEAAGDSSVETSDPPPAPPGGRRFGMLSGWRPLTLFWVVLLAGLGIAGGVLQWLGPPSRLVASLSEPIAAVPHAAPAPGFPAVPGTIPAPSAALLDSRPGGPPLPRIAADGMMPARAYAAYFDRADAHPKVALLIASIGLSEADSLNAIRALPAAVSLAISPYAPQLEHLLDDARSGGHETLISTPMESNGFPQNDAGEQSLLTGLDWAQNQQRLDWALGRISGYVGATAIMGGLRGEHFADTAQMGLVLDALARRGLIYLDARPPIARPAGPAQMRPGWRRADLVIDDSATPADIDARLAELADLARRTGSAVGVAGAPAPVTVDRIATWATSLPANGVSLVPISALVPLPEPPARPAAATVAASPAPPAANDTASPEVSSP